MKIQVNGVNIAYDDRGTGPPIVFLHAFPLNRTMWAPQEAALSGRFRTISIDAALVNRMRRFGATVWSNTPMT